MHFFIDITKLIDQVASNFSYGVDSTNPLGYLVTSQFQLTEIAKAFACQDSLMIVQQSDVDEALVNIILKPIEGLKIPFSSVQYFVYRGISKNSFFNGGSIIAENASDKSELIDRLWKDYNNFKINHPKIVVEQLKPQDLGYDNVLTATLNIENVFDSSQSGIRPVLVKEGEWIGNFAFQNSTGSDVPIGFEIVVSSELINIDVQYVRNEKQYIDVNGLSGLELRAKKEQILSFIDPAAFFGLHFESGISISSFDSATKSTIKKKGADLYTLILSKFATKNRVYVDIRSEHGYSYNFYQNYNDGSENNVKIGNSLTVPVAQSYSSNDWPILYTDSSLATTKTYNDLKLQLRIDDNTKPIIFFQDTNLLGSDNNSRFIDDKLILNGIDTDWSKEISFVFPNVDSVSTKDNVAYYIKLHYFRQEFNTASPNTVLKNETYFNSAFCPIDLPNLGNVAYLFQQVQSSEAKYINGFLPNTPNRFDYIADSGAIWDNDRILFYSQAVFQNKKTGQFYSQYTGIENKFSLDSKNFSLSFLKNDVNITCKVMQEETGENQFTPVKSISISHYNGFLSAKENILLIGIKTNELESLIFAADAVDPNTQRPNLSDKHHRYLFLEEDLPTPKTDKEGISFRKFKLKIQGIAPNGDSSIIAPNEDIFLYSRDGLCFTSKEFAKNETVNNVSNFIDFFPLDANNLYNSIRRLSMLTTDTVDWQLYAFDGTKKKYDTGDVNYAGNSIGNQEIKLPVGTRSIILGRSKRTINQFYCYYIVCFHQGQYREGFIDVAAFNNSNKGGNNTFTRVNELEGKNNTQILGKSFLDDSNHILKYLEAYVAVETVNNVTLYQPFLNLLTNTRTLFNTVSQLTTSVLNDRLHNLFIILRSLDLKASNTGNLKANLNNIPDSFDRWLSNQPFYDLINSLPSSNVILTLRFNSDWIHTWNDISKDNLFYMFYNDSANKSDMDTLVNYFDLGSSGLTISSTSSESISITKSALKKLSNHLINRDTKDLINKTPEAIWLRSLTNSVIDTTTVFVIINTKAWGINNQNNFFAEFAALDNSIGYIDNDYLYSLLIHEYNDSSGIVSGSSRSILLENTHINIQNTTSLFELIKTKLQEGNALDFFKDDSNVVQFYQRNRQYHRLFIYTPFISLIYLKYYLTKILQT